LLIAVERDGSSGRSDRKPSKSTGPDIEKAAMSSRAAVAFGQSATTKTAKTIGEMAGIIKGNLGRRAAPPRRM
jgi:hypothetical protein